MKDKNIDNSDVSCETPDNTKKTLDDTTGQVSEKTANIIDKDAELQRLYAENQALKEKVETIENQHYIQRIEDMLLGVVAAAELKDNETNEHTRRIGTFSGMLAGLLRDNGVYVDQITDQFIKFIELKAPLHDLGKVGIEETILLKPGKLTPKERKVMETHTTIGHNTIADLEQRSEKDISFSMAKNITKYHHEKRNGTGYPEGLKGSQIPLEARIVAIVDVFDALLSKRPYKDGLSPEYTYKLIHNDRGHHFDPKVAKTFLENYDDFIKIRLTMLSDEEK